MNVSGPSLLLNRARVTGAGASRSLLAEGLARVPLTGLGLAPGELLVIPRHRSRAVLRTGADGAVEPGFGRSLGSELAATAATAMVDPLPGQHAAAYRFRSRASLAIWLLGTDVRPGGCADQPAAAALAAQLPGGSVLAWARRELFEAGQELPGIVAALTRQGLAAAWLARLDPADVGRMRHALWQSHGLPLSAPASPDPEAALGLQGIRPQPSGRPVSKAGADQPAGIPALAATAAAADAAGNDLTSLPRQALELLLTLLRLKADPGTPRAALAAAAATVAAGLAMAPPRSQEPLAPPASVAPLAPEATSTAGAVAAEAPASAFEGNARPSPATPSPLRVTPARPAAGPPRPWREALRPPQHPARRGPRAALGGSAATPTPPPTPASASENTASALPGLGFRSAYAGVWFLCNAFVAMGLYGDFSRPRDRLLALAPSRLLDRLALGWFGRAYGDDPLHRALLRDATDPPLPRRWQVRPEWLEAFDDAQRPGGGGQRRRPTLWHPAGFPLAASRRAPAMAQAAAAARRVGYQPERGRAGAGRPSRRGSHPRGGGATGERARRLPSRPEERWLACLALYLEARIQRATGDPALGLSSLAIPGQCRISPERVDVDMALEELPLPLRLAGLDRDPGWLPAEGRAIAFHFH